MTKNTHPTRRSAKERKSDKAKGKRYSYAEKQEVLNMVEKINQAEEKLAQLKRDYVAMQAKL